MPKHARWISFAAALVAVSMTALIACWRARPPASPPPSPALRNDQVTWYLHRAVFLGSFRRRSTFVSFATTGPVPSRDQLVAALDNPQSFAAAHMLLLNGPAPTTRPGTFDADSDHRDMALRLASAGSVTLHDQPDGSCVATIDGLRVILRPGEKKGSYFGQGRVDHTIYAAAAEIDPSQQPAIRERWNERPAR